MSGGFFFEDWNKLETDIQNELIYRHARKTPLGVLCRCCPRCCCKRKCVIAAYVSSIGYGVCAFLLLSGFLIFIIRPHLMTLHYRSTHCTTWSSKLEDDRAITCLCAGAKASCSSSYPCLLIYVNYTRHDGRRVNAQLYADEHAGPCSYSPHCSRHKSTNAGSVRSYKTKFGWKGKRFPCLYNPGSSDHVLQKRNDSEFILPFWLIPTVISSVCLLGFLLTCCTCGLKHGLKIEPTTRVSLIAIRLERQGIGRLEPYSPASRWRLIEECSVSRLNAHLLDPDNPSHRPDDEHDPAKRVFNPPPINEVLEDSDVWVPRHCTSV